MNRSTEQTVGFIVAFSLVFLGGLLLLRTQLWQQRALSAAQVTTPTPTPAVPTPTPVSYVFTPTPTPIPPPNPSTVLLDQSGNGITTTQRFQAPSEWRIDYTWSACQIPNFSVSIGGDSLDIFSRQGNGGSGTDYEHAGGSEYLSVNSACDWHLVVSG